MSYFLYYMITERCNLCCRYCFKGAIGKNLKSEMNLDEIKKTIYCLYHTFGIRKLTISGGEPTMLIDNNCCAFLSVIDYLKQFKSKENDKNLQVVIITNAIKLTPEVTSKMVGIVDKVIITIDALDEKILTKIGRNNNVYKNYIKRTTERLFDLNNKGFDIKIHTVVSPVNLDNLVDLANYLLSLNINISKWKFFQYTPFGDKNIDKIFDITDKNFREFKYSILSIDNIEKLNPTFKLRETAQDTFFNLMPDGRIEYSKLVNGECLRNYTNQKIFEYNSWNDLLLECGKIFEQLLEKHIIKSKT